MQTTLTLTDPVFDQASEKNAVSRWLTQYLADERDLPFVYLASRLTLLIVPFAAMFFWVSPAQFPWWSVPFYWAIIGWYAGPYNLMLHNTSHRLFFKRENVWANRYVSWILGPFFGHAPDTYFIHHVGMHHPENNLPEDLSSTMKYQRDSIRDFLRYYFAHVGSIFVTLPIYLHKKKRTGLRNTFVLSAYAYYASFWLLAYCNWRATLVVFVMPYIVMHFAMMCGNWGQHAFVDAATPENCYRNSITCINGVYNRRCFNDGYHIGHHLKATRHWTDMPEEFLRNRETYAQERAIVFHTIDFFIVWAFLMAKRYDKLASYYVELDGKGRSKDEIIALLRSRTARIPAVSFP